MAMPAQSAQDAQCGYTRGYQMPSETQSTGFSFGVPSGQDFKAKDLIYPQGGALEERP